MRAMKTLNLAATLAVASHMKKVMLVLSVVGIALGSAVPSKASAQNAATNWVQIQWAPPYYWKMWYDANRASRVNNVVDTWVEVMSDGRAMPQGFTRKASTNGSTIWYWIEHDVVDCNSQQLMIHEFTSYAQGNVILDSYGAEPTDAFSKQDAGTTGAATVTLLCNAVR